VQYIDDECFQECTALVEVDLTSAFQLRTLPIGCFSNCTSLTYIELPNSITTLNNYCFSVCTSLETVILSTSLTSLSDYCFNGCDNLETIYLPDSITTLGIDCFFSCDKLPSINLSSITSLDDNCFKDCVMLSSIDLSSITSLGAYCFEACYALESITFTNSITSLSLGCFQQCISLETINLPNSITTLNNYCFNICSALTSVTVPSSVTSLGEGCFAYCDSLTTIIYDDPSRITLIGINQFYASYFLQSVTFYLTSPIPPYPTTGVYNTNIYPNNTNFIYIAGSSCFNEGTKILCLNKNFEEEYIPIENLKKGDLVKSYKHGYRKIYMIGKQEMKNNTNYRFHCMYKMEKTDENELIEDLIVTGAHGILLDKHTRRCREKIDDKWVLPVTFSNLFKKIEDTNVYTYYHLILENNNDCEQRFCIWANGMLTETPSETQFKKHNYILLD
jgi:hypothetical protein